MTDFIRIKLNIPKTNGMAVSDVTERVLKRPMLVPAVMLLLCCCLTYLSESALPLLISAGILVITGVIAYLKRNLTLMFCVLISLLLVFVSCIRILSVLSTEIPVISDEFHTGIVISCERKLSGKNSITAVIGGVRVDLTADNVSDPAFPAPGMCFTASGKFKEPDSPGNPGEFNYKAYLKRKGIKYRFYAESLTVFSVPEGLHKLCLSFPEFCFRVRSRLFECFTQGMDEANRGLVAAVCLGDTSLSEESDIRAFKLSGCSHLLAVSGTHFAGFLAALPFVLRTILPNRKKGTVIYFIFAFLIAGITGWSESVTRAAFMSSAAFAGKDSLSSMSASAIVMMAADPFCSVRTGFLLSFTACISIMLLSGRISCLFAFLKEKQALISALSVQTAAVIGLMPFSGMIQSRTGIIQFIVQAIGSFLAKCACIMFVPGAVLSFLFKGSTVFSMPSAFFLGLLRKAVGAGSRYSLAASGGKPVEPVFMISFWLFVFVMLMPQFAFKKLLIKVSCALIAVCSGFMVFGILNPVEAEVVFADVGQGDCCLIMAGNKTCLIDSGTYEKGDKTVSDLLDHYGIDSVDIAFMTHWDQDHAGGIAALHRKGRIKKIYTGFIGNDTDTEAFERSIRLRGCDTVTFRRALNHTKAGDCFVFSPKIRLKVVYPEKDFSGGNPGSLVMVLDCCGRQILFTGDIGAETEEMLISEGKIHDADILKVSHHGSKYSSTDAFLSKSKPELSVISVSKNNLYGHPSPKTLERLAKAGSYIFRTDKDGAVMFKFY